MRKFIPSLVLLTASAAIAAPIAPPPAPNPAQRAALAAAGLNDPTNAALLHVRAWSMVRSEQLTQFNKLWTEQGEVPPGPGWKPSADLVSAVNELAPYIEASLRAAAVPQADWGVEYSLGYNALLPHLGQLRTEARVLLANARIRLAYAKPENRDQGVESLAAIFRIANHIRNDRTLISSLVGRALVGVAAESTIKLIDGGLITKADAPILLEAARSIPAEDPFNMLGALVGERPFAAFAFIQSGPDAGRKGLEHYQRAFGIDPETDPQMKAAAAAIRAMDEAALAADVARRVEFFEQSAAIFREQPADGAERLQALADRASKGDFGSTLQLTVPSFVRPFSADAAGRALLRSVIEKLEALQ